MDLLFKYFMLTGMHKDLISIPYYGLARITFNGVDVTSKATSGSPDDIWA